VEMAGEAGGADAVEGGPGFRLQSEGLQEGMWIMRTLCRTWRVTVRSVRAHSRRLGCEQTGSELFEFALLAPVLLTFLLGIVWMGRAYNVKQTITRAAREGARYAVLPNCATCGDVAVDTYTTLGTSGTPACLTNPTNVFTNYVSPALQASNIDPNGVQSYCQQAQWINPDSDLSVGQCGVVISFKYPVKVAIPFTTLNFATLTIPTQVQMRMENQRVDNNAGSPQCP
jgi:Flp pilus assembly protein TadG